MAIVIEEEKKNSNIAPFIGWFVILGILAVAAYYIFLAPPPAAVVSPPPQLADITALTQIGSSQVNVVSSTQFQSLRQYITEPTSTGPAPIGRTNPFVSP
ncbi:MAG TPA: hypothetical protein VMT81_00965 [Candidatus Paceibacterota bacterium]|nr:hypothetical protein [Candidatus Paceibacterota bacterium]